MAAIALACALVALGSSGVLPVHADTIDQFRSSDLTLALPGDGDPSFITFDLLLADDGSPDFDARAAAVHDELLSRFPGAVPVTSGEVSAQYLLSRFKWHSGHPAWSYNPAGKPTALLADTPAVADAAASWGAAGAKAGFVNGGITSATPDACQNVPDGRNTVGWRTQSGNVLAITCTYWSPSTGATEFDMQIDPRWTWTTEASVVRMDLQSVVTHEFGHALGLDHPCDLNQPSSCTPSARAAVMYGAYAAGTNRRTQQPDDIAGLVAVYGPGDVAASPVVTPVAASPQATLQPVLTHRHAVAGISRE